MQSPSNESLSRLLREGRKREPEEKYTSIQLGIMATSVICFCKKKKKTETEYLCKPLASWNTQKQASLHIQGRLVQPGWWKNIKAMLVGWLAVYFMCAVHFILTVVQPAFFFWLFRFSLLHMNVYIRKSSMRSETRPMVLKPKPKFCRGWPHALYLIHLEDIK